MTIGSGRRPERATSVRAMNQWEYRAESWVFMGAYSDKWTDRSEYRNEVNRRRREVGSASVGVLVVGDRLDTRADFAYLMWRDAAENDYLNAMGDAGWELVTLHRIVTESRVDPERFWPTIQVRAYFKREASPNAPETPRNPIGFRQRAF